MSADISNKLTSARDTTNPVTTTVASTRAISGTSLFCVSLDGWPTDTAVHFITYKKTTAGLIDKTTQCDWKGVVSGTTIGTLTLKNGTDGGNDVGDFVQMAPTAAWEQDYADALTLEHNQDGTHGAVTATSVSASGNITATGTITAASFVQSGVGGANGWTVGLAAPNTVTYNGNRSYNLVFNSTDLTGTLSPGMRLRTTRTVAAPTQCTSLNGSTQYYSKTSPAGMTFTDDFTVSAWVKLTSYGNQVHIASRYNGTSGWDFNIQTTGQVALVGFNGGSSNLSDVISYQSIPLNKWVHIQANLDMSAFTTNIDGGASGSFIAIDGVVAPCSVARGGTNPTALVQAGNLEIGSWDGGLQPFPGKIAQVAIFNTKITLATMQGYISQGLAGTETSLISAYSFNNSINDLNTTNANNLTANGSAVATNADSPFGGQAGSTISSTLDYAIVTKTAFSTNTTLTVQVPEGCTIPTSGGVSAVSYSGVKAPYGMPVQRGKWKVLSTTRSQNSTAINTTTVQLGGVLMTCPIGSWVVSLRGSFQVTSGGTTFTSAKVGLSTSSSSFSGDLDNAKVLTPAVSTSTTETDGYMTTWSDFDASAQTPIYLIGKTAANVTLFYGANDTGNLVVELENAYL